MIKDFEQKRRNRPIEITDIAINKVRTTRFYGFTKEQLLYIQDRHKELLREAQKLNKVHNSNLMEVGILIDLFTWRYWIIHGTNKREVQMKNNLDAYRALESAGKNRLMFMHNHPSTGTFSGEDFKYFCNHESLYIITAIGNDGTIYSLTKTPQFNINVLSKYIEKAEWYKSIGKITNNGTLAMRDILSIASDYGLIYKKGGRK